MIKYLFNKPLLSCDFPSEPPCLNYIHLQKPEVADTVLEKNKWMALSVGNKIVFLCRFCKIKTLKMSKEDFIKMKEAATAVPTK